MMKKGFERSRFLDDFYIAGFKYYDGLSVINNLQLGEKVDLVLEDDNPHDINAVAIYFNNVKLGYVPAERNSLISDLLYFGHDIFDAKIMMVKLDTAPERQFKVVVSIKDNR